MLKEYRTIREVVGPLMLVDGVSPSLESFVDMGVDDQFRAGKLGRLTLEEAPCEKQQPSG